MPPLGPSDPTRSVASEQLLPVARAAAAEAGVTRLAELTRLDRLGLPVWQAVRPLSRALSVHQGKGATDADAQVGALLEAAESHAAETFEAPGPTCRFDALPRRQRAPCLGDFAADRRRPPPAAQDHHWVATTDIVSGGTFYLPHEIVSLDLTRNVPSSFDRASNGIATGATIDEAVAVALQELIERDAVREWQAGGLLACTACALRLDTVELPWVHWWRKRLEEAGVALRFYAVPSISGTPVFVCEVNDFARDDGAYRAIHGRGCHPLPELALFKALAEALQGRATYIAGAREDLLPSAYRAGAAGVVKVAYGLPLPPGMRGVEWSDITPGPIGRERIVAALVAAGYPQIALVELARRRHLAIVRAFVCGLGSIQRRRRPPLR